MGKARLEEHLFIVANLNLRKDGEGLSSFVAETSQAVPLP
jgi:hypothetical protein